MDEAERKRQERNRKQREYRARRKAEESEEIRQERNKRRRDERLFNRTKILTNNNTQGANHGILHASSAQDKKNVFPDENMDWLHTNQNYVRTRQPTYDNSCVFRNLLGHTLLDASEATPGAILLFYHF